MAGGGTMTDGEAPGLRTHRDFKKVAIATAVAMGVDRERLCQMYGYTPGGLTQLLATPEMQELVAAKQEWIANQAALSAMNLVGQLHQTVENIKQMANDLTHKDSYRANEKIFDFFMPKVQKHEVDLHHEVSGQLTTLLVDGFAEMKRVLGTGGPIEDDPHLLTGEVAAASALEAPGGPSSPPNGEAPSDGQ